MPARLEKYWETRIITFTSTTIPILVARLYGGEAITIKQTATGSESVYIGEDKEINTRTYSYQMDNGETLSIGLDARFGRDAYIEIWALPESTSDKLCYMKVIGHAPETEAT